MSTQESIINRKFNFETEIAYASDAIVSKTLIKTNGGTLTLFAFDKDQELSEHSASFDVLVQLMDGRGEFIVGGVSHHLSKGECLIMPADIPHAVKATEAFKMLLTMIKKI